MKAFITLGLKGYVVRGGKEYAIIKTPKKFPAIGETVVIDDVRLVVKGFRKINNQTGIEI